jgi:hypothetical protein
MGPRDLLISDHRSLFGRASAVMWEPDVPEVERRAAGMQHSAATELRSVLRNRGETVGEVAASWHLDAEGVRRKLRGEVWAGLRDLARWSIYVGEAESE